MKRYLGAIAAVAVAGVLATQTNLIGRDRGERPKMSAAEPPAAEPPAAEPAAAEAPVPEAPAAETDAAATPAAGADAASIDGQQAAGLQARIDSLTGEIDAREAALADLRTALAERDASLAEATAALEARDAELRDLRKELDALRERYAFDIQLAAMKSDATVDADPGVPIAAVAVVDADALIAAAKAPPSDQPLTSVQFDTGSSALSPGGQIHAAAAAVMIGEMTLGRVRVVGHTDRVGSPERNRVLAEARARTVADFLVASGVSSTLIEARGMGEADMPIQTSDGVAEPLNRSVAIIAVPLPTS